jgi:hypothetical protein
MIDSTTAFSQTETTSSKLSASKPLMLTVLVLGTLANIPTVEASGSAYAKCFKACMDGAGNAAIVAFPICATLCAPALAL